MKKIIIIMTALLMTVSCAQKNKKDILVYAHTGELTTLDPVYSYDAVTHGILLNIYETLIGFNKDSLTDYIPLISEKVPAVENGLIKNNGKTYIFPIRSNIKFHNGYSLTSEDVKYSLLRFMIMDISGGPSSLLLEPVFGISSVRDENGNIKITKQEFENAVKVEGNSVIVNLKRPFAPFISIVARWSYIMSKKWAVENGEWDGKYETIKAYTNRPKEKDGIFYKANGTGPFKVLKWDINKKQIILQRFENYWRERPEIKTIMAKTVSEFSTRRLMIERGDADIIDVPRVYQDQMEGIKGVKLYTKLKRLMTDPVFFFTFKINPDGNPDIGSGKLDGNGIPPDFFKDINVRKAFAYSFDYERFLNESLKDKAEMAYGPIPPGIEGYSRNIKHYEFDLKKAKEYFKKAYNGKLWEKGFKLTLNYNTGSDMRQIACEILKKNIESLNPKFKIDIKALDWAIYLEKTQNKKMPVFTRGWVGDYPDAHNFIFPFYHSNGRYPQAQGYSSKKLDKLIEQAVKLTDRNKRKKLYEEIVNYAQDQVIQIYTVHPYGVIAMRDNIKGFYNNPIHMGIYFYSLSKE